MFSSMRVETIVMPEPLTFYLSRNFSNVFSSGGYAWEGRITACYSAQPKYTTRKATREMDQCVVIFPQQENSLCFTVYFYKVGKICHVLSNWECIALQVLFILQQMWLPLESSLKVWYFVNPATHFYKILICLAKDKLGVCIILVYHAVTNSGRYTVIKMYYMSRLGRGSWYVWHSDKGTQYLPPY